MRQMTATVVRVLGTCNAGYSVGDKVVVNRDDACIDKERSDSLCIYALRSILSNMVRVADARTILASCPDPATGYGGNVVFSITTREIADANGADRSQ